MTAYGARQYGFWYGGRDGLAGRSFRGTAAASDGAPATFVARGARELGPGGASMVASGVEVAADTLRRRRAELDDPTPAVGP